MKLEGFSHRQRASLAGVELEDARQALADSGLTLVVYMGVMRAGEIRQQLLDAGKPVELPVTIVERASLPGERVLGTSLGALERTIVEQSVVAPALLMIGQAVAAGSAASASEESLVH